MMHSAEARVDDCDTRGCGKLAVEIVWMRYAPNSDEHWNARCEQHAFEDQAEAEQYGWGFRQRTVKAGAR